MPPMRQKPQPPPQQAKGQTKLSEACEKTHHVHLAARTLSRAGTFSLFRAQCVASLELLKVDMLPMPSPHPRAPRAGGRPRRRTCPNREILDARYKTLVT